MDATIIAFNDEGLETLDKLNAQPIKACTPQVNERVMLYHLKIKRLIYGTITSMKQSCFEFSSESAFDAPEAGVPLFNSNFGLIGILIDSDSLVSATTAQSTFFQAVNIEHILSACVGSRLDRYVIFLNSLLIKSIANLVFHEIPELSNEF